MITALVVKFTNGNEHFAGYLKESRGEIEVSSDKRTWYKVTVNSKVENLYTLDQGNKVSHRFTFNNGCFRFSLRSSTESSTYPFSGPCGMYSNSLLPHLHFSGL